MRRIILGAAAAAAAALGVGLGGCATTGPAGGRLFGQADSTAYSYRAGTATQAFASPPRDVEKAAAEAMADLSIHSLRTIRDPATVTFEGTTADNRRATVTVRPESSIAATSVRIGLLGDEALSRAVLDRVGIRLGAQPPKPIPTETETAVEEEKPGRFSRQAVPDEVMLKGQGDPGVGDSPIPWR